MNIEAYNTNNDIYSTIIASAHIWIMDINNRSMDINKLIVSNNNCILK